MLLGSETEFGLLGGCSSPALAAIQRQVESGHVHLRGTCTGAFFANGARSYVDMGVHSEYASPEVDDPLALVCCELAGRRIMEEAAARTGNVLLCSNVDYAGSAWGTHENYECNQPLTEVCLTTLVTHLATRILYTGAGGPHPLLPGMQLVMSPRAAVTAATLFGQLGVRWSMISPKARQLGSALRVHVTCGESLLCSRANWLKYGTTALVLHCFNDSLAPRPIALRDALRTMHALNRDIDYSSRYETIDGRRVTALEIQRRLADAVASRREVLPPWGEGVLAAWHRVLDALDAREERLTGMIDWLLFRKLWLTLAAENGFGAADLRRLQRECVLHPPAPAAYTLLCQHARELYVRMHALHDASPFRRAAAAGWVEPAILGLDERRIRRAMSHAPAGRAANRGKLIVRLAHRSWFAADWDCVVDKRKQVRAEIPRIQPWRGALKWRPLPDARCRAEPVARPITKLIALVRTHEVSISDAEFYSCFRTGDYGTALGLLHGRSRAPRPRSAGTDPQTLALTYARMGMASEAVVALESRGTPDAANMLFCCVNFGLTPPLDVCNSVIEEARSRELMPRPSDANGIDAEVFAQCLGWVLLHEGQLDRAVGVLGSVVEVLDCESRPRMLSRTRCFLAEALRRRGDRARAGRELRAAASIYVRENLPGDAADHLVPVLAKLAPRRTAVAALRAAETLHRRRGQWLGLARVLCLRARIDGTPTALDELRALRGRVEVLADCPHFERITSRWEEWTSGAGAEGEERFWGL